MKIKQILSILCAAAVISMSACQSSEIVENGGAGASTSDTSDTTADTAAETEMSDTSTTTTTTPAVSSEKNETTISKAQETTVSETETTTTTPAVTTAVTTSEPAETTTTVSSDTKEETTTTGLPESVPSNEAPYTDDIEITIESDGEITTDTDNFTLRMTYVGDENRSYWLGVEYKIERYENGEWKDFPFAEGMAWIEIAYELSSRSNAVFGISLRDEMYKEPVTAGKYRVVKTINGEEYYAEFEVTDKSDDYDYIEESGTVSLGINEIKADEFVCRNVYPLPGVYHVKCDTSKYDEYCVGDQIEVDYSAMYRIHDDDISIILETTDIRPTNITLDPDVCYKPVIYLYPEEKTEVSVSVDFNGRLTVTDPEYADGWTVTASPDGTIIHEGREYPYLFWEGDRDFELDTSKGFCVSGEETEEFLTEKLAYLGLNEKETAEFLEFWLPFMKNNKYNVITFAGSDYTDNAALDISPSPDTVIRVFMVFGASDEYVEIPAQELEKAPERNGFTVVEWGGSVEK